MTLRDPTAVDVFLLLWMKDVQMEEEWTVRGARVIFSRGASHPQEDRPGGKGSRLPMPRRLRAAPTF
ncbi:hypothetical protein OJAV_G00144480 [Oryzias javanicus]|uniref:Uncharacterized protein n=1 Tax=Oryzias javanicus TaxID=123683 RepID=A0A437CN70_ORYJA|nr:hypothetical protein OJAV_G00144480 [Oryzias javanicus]